MSGIRGILAGFVLLSGLGIACPVFAGDAALAGLAREAGMDAYPVPLKAPAFNLAALNSETRTLADYKGRVVLLNFWASWCPPCREEFPSLVRLHKAVGGERFTVLAIAVRDAEEAVSGFLAQGRPVFDVLLDQDGATATAWHAAGVPVTYLLDRQGRLLAGKVGPLQWDSAAMQRLVRHVLEQRQGER
jgi:thiol-disulfide isomerase/thioredoxin